MFRVVVGWPSTSQSLDRLELRCRRLPAEEGDHVALSGRHLAERILFRRVPHLARPPQEGRDLEAERIVEFRLDRALEVGGSTTGLEEDVAARDVGRDVLEAELLEEGAQAVHGDPPPADVHSTEEGDVPHGRTKAQSHLLRPHVVVESGSLHVL